ncbi:hypothetical protein [Empedobacter falsenii]|nr:hypothetical protein [Flavobacteriaceae bacterium]
MKNIKNSNKMKNIKNLNKIYRLVNPALYTFATNYFNQSELESRLKFDCIFITDEENNFFEEMIGLIFELDRIREEENKYTLLLDVFWDFYNKKLDIDIDSKIVDCFLKKVSQDSINIYELFTSVLNVVWEYRPEPFMDIKKYISSKEHSLEAITLLIIRDFMSESKYDNRVYLDLEFTPTMCTEGEIRFMVSNLTLEAITKISNIILSIDKNDLIIFENILDNFSSNYLQSYFDLYTGVDQKCSVNIVNNNLKEFKRIFEKYEIDFIYKYFGIDTKLDIETPDVFYDLGSCIIHIYNIIYKN